MKYSFLSLLFSVASLLLSAQENYEIQVYGAELVAPKHTMLELHSNFTNNGDITSKNQVVPSNQIVHETIEITHGWNSWLETGFYLFNSIGNNNRTAYVGSHIRPRISVPKSWNLPVGLSLSTEVGYQKRRYSEDDWSLEIRPIIDKQWEKLYLSFNPTFDKSLHGLNKTQGFNFSPNFKASYTIHKKYSPGLEYYGSLGSLKQFNTATQQQHQLFACLDIEFSEDWEFNAGYGLGFTRSSDNEIVKFIVGYRFHK